MISLPIPVAALDQHIVVLGKTRSGKSTAMRVLVEGLLDRKKPVCIVDPKGDWWGLKSSADGKSAGYPIVIFGGPHGDVPINEHSGAAIAELIATGNRPSLIDLKGWMPAARTRFWVDFSSALFKLTKGLRWLVVDEVHNFAPKAGHLDPDAAKALHWTNRLASEGLGMGLHMIFASQRPQKVHNDTLTSAETLIAMRVIHPSDRDAVSDWIKGCGDPKLGAEVLGTLADMNRGEGWVWSPEIKFGPKRIQFPMFSTYDSFKPQPVEATLQLKGWASVDLDDVKAKLSKVVEEAKANDPAILRKQIADLQRQLKGAATAMSSDASAQSLARERQAGFEEGRSAGYVDGYNAAIARVRILAEPMKDIAGKIGRVAAAFDGLLELKKPDSPIKKVPPLPVVARAAFSPADPVRPRPPANGAGEKLPTGEHAVLTVIAQYLGNATKEQISILTGYKRSSRDAYLARLRTKGLVGENALVATGAGIDALGSFEPLPTGDALRDYWLGKLPEGERKMLTAICSVYPAPADRHSIGEASGYKRSSTDAYVARLMARQLIVKVGTQIKAAAELFEEGRR